MSIIDRNRVLEILQAYTNFLVFNGYADSDVYCEPPTTIDQFIATKQFPELNIIDDHERTKRRSAPGI